MSFSVSQKVVCVDDGYRPSTTGARYYKPNGRVVKGVVYVVGGLFGPFADGVYRPTIIGLPNIFIISGEDTGWAPSRFRPLEELKQEAADRQRMDQPCPH